MTGDICLERIYIVRTLGAARGNGLPYLLKFLSEKKPRILPYPKEWVINRSRGSNEDKMGLVSTIR